MQEHILEPENPGTRARLTDTDWLCTRVQTEANGMDFDRPMLSWFDFGAESSPLMLKRLHSTRHCDG